MGKRKVVADEAKEGKESLNAVDDCDLQKSKKKKKKTLKALFNGDDTLSVENENTCKTNHDEVDLDIVRPNLGDDLVEHKKLKKKRKRKHYHDDHISKNGCEDNDILKGLKSVMSKPSIGQTEDMLVAAPGESPRKKRKKDKKKNRNSEKCLESLENGGTCTGAVVVNGDVAAENRKDKTSKKKKKKQRDTVEDNNFNGNEVYSKVTTTDDAVTSTNIDIHRTELSDICENKETSSNEIKRSKHKKKAKKNRKQKLEKIAQDEEAEQDATKYDTEVEKADDSHTKENSTKGQWKTASFESSDRQDKFIRLLGGYKKGCDKQALKSKFNVNDNKIKPKSDLTKGDGSHQERPNMAMTSVQEKLYSIALENQYEKAKYFNQKRGTGLGFENPPEEGKKFYIDVKKAKSIKFDD